MPRRTSNPVGVIVRDAHIQIDLRAYGYGRERLELAPTPANIRYAERVRLEILGKIERGTFALEQYFPNSPRVGGDNRSLTFKQLADEWLATRTDIEHSTRDHYDQTINSYHFKGWHKKHLVDIDFRTLKALLASLPQTPKTFNNIATILRQILEYGFRAKLLREPLYGDIEFHKNVKVKPDPLTLDEVNVILSKMADDEARDYYEFAFFSGLRPSEQIALRWSKVDLRNGTVLVDEARTRGKDKGTKTDRERTVELTSRARQVLERQRMRTQLAGGHVFHLAGARMLSTDAPLDAWWKSALRLSGVRYRDARQTRHTFATVCLHAGITPGWVAQQLGHSTEMFYRVYSRWIEGADKGAERRKLDAFLAPTGTGT